MAALASLADLEARLGAQVTADQLGRALQLLDDASLLVRGEAGPGLVDPPSDVAVMVTARAAARAFHRADGVTQESHDDYSYRLAGGGADLYLTETELRLLRAATGAVGGRVRSVVLGSAMHPPVDPAVLPTP